MPIPSIGQPAPDFELPDQNGNPVRLSQFLGRHAVVVYFYPKDDTSVCTKQACGFRDDFARFQAAGAVILGISSDGAASHTKFVNKYSLPFTLLTDKGGKVASLYGARRAFGMLPSRVTYVIDRDGIVRHTYSGVFEAGPHVESALRALNA